jgi:acyl carrier protein phosphodiesterase
LTGSGAELAPQYAGYQADFFEFLPAARRYAEDCRRRRGRIG